MSPPNLGQPAPPEAPPAAPTPEEAEALENWARLARRPFSGATTANVHARLFARRLAEAVTRLLGGYPSSRPIGDLGVCGHALIERAAAWPVGALRGVVHLAGFPGGEPTVAAPLRCGDVRGRPDRDAGRWVAATPRLPRGRRSRSTRPTRLVGHDAGSRRRRGCDEFEPTDETPTTRGRWVAAAPRPPRGRSVEAARLVFLRRSTASSGRPRRRSTSSSTSSRTSKPRAGRRRRRRRATRSRRAGRSARRSACPPERRS